ncbi:unnamed protein product [Schistosoma turkestanicum]|nr:unnamed protein product [Schistosoma turkestanicum]
MQNSIRLQLIFMPVVAASDNLINELVDHQQHHHHSDNLSCETIYNNDTFNNNNTTDVSSDPIDDNHNLLSYLSSSSTTTTTTQLCLPIGTPYKTSNIIMDAIRNTCEHSIPPNETLSIIPSQQLQKKFYNPG